MKYEEYKEGNYDAGDRRNPYELATPYGQAPYVEMPNAVHLAGVVEVAQRERALYARQLGAVQAAGTLATQFVYPMERIL